MRKIQKEASLNYVSVARNSKHVEKLIFRAIQGCAIWIALLSTAVASTSGLPSPGLVTFDPLWNEPEFLSARVALEKRNWPDAIPLLQNVITKFPHYLPAVLRLSHALVYQDRRSEALALLVKEIKVSNGSDYQILKLRLQTLSQAFLTNRTFQLYQDGVNYLQAGKYKSAKDRFEQAAIDETDNCELLVRLGQSAILTDDTKQALTYLKMAKKLNPFHPEIQLWLGRALQLSGANAEAVSEFQLAKAELAHSELTTIWYAQSLVASGQPGQALKTLELDARNNPSHVLSLIESARIRLGSKNPPLESLRFTRRQLQLANGRLDAYLSQSPINEGELALDFKKSLPDPASDLQNLIKLAQSKIDASPPAEKMTGTHEPCCRERRAP